MKYLLCERIEQHFCPNMSNLFIVRTPSAFLFIRLLDTRFAEFIPKMVLTIFLMKME